MKKQHPQSNKIVPVSLNAPLPLFFACNKTMLRAGITVLLVWASLTIAYAQRENIWIFGNGAGVDFTSGTPIAIESKMPNAFEASASICDAYGSLLFYTEGSTVWNRDNIPMSNGRNLTDMSFISTTASPTISTSQGALIVPVPGNNQQYYIFSLSSAEYGPDAGRLYYSIVDMSRDNGRGDVVPEKKAILLDTYLTEHMVSASGDRCNIWLIVAVRQQSRLKAFEITEAGINPAPVISDFDRDNSSLFITGRMNMAPDQKKMALGRTGSLELYDFNPGSGHFSNRIILEKKLNYGVCFSPDNSKLYGCGMDSIYQFDLSSGTESAIIASKTGIAPPGFTDLKRGPDGKIYFSMYSHLGSIDFPNLAGIACQYKETSVALKSGTTASIGLPNAVSSVLQEKSFTSATVKAGCFANARRLLLRARDTGATWGYQWNNGATDTFLSVHLPGTYWLRYYTAPCIMHVDTFDVQFPHGVLPAIQIRAACRRETNGGAYPYTYPGDTVSYHYTWLDNTDTPLSDGDTLRDVAAGLYKLRVRTAHCDTTIIFAISEEDYRASFLADSLACEGELLPLQNTSDTHFTGFLWHFGDGDSARQYTPQHRYKQPGAYPLRLIGLGPVCTDTVYKTIVVDALNPHFYIISNQDSACTGESLYFQTGKDNTLYHLQWRFGDADIYTTNDHYLQHAFSQPGLYVVQLGGHFRACPDRYASDTVYISPLPIIDLGADSILCPGNRPLSLSNRAANIAENYRYQWNTGDSTDTIHITTPGRYSLTMTDNRNCSATGYTIIHKSCYLDIPNAFTPNGDGINDYFFPRLPLPVAIASFHLNVFNRWGQLLFETRNADGMGWDGHYAGIEQPEGAYIYKIEIGSQSRTEQYEGTILLLR